MINVSEIVSYLKCPRLAYFRSKFGSKLNEMNAVRENIFEFEEGLRPGMG